MSRFLFLLHFLPFSLLLLLFIVTNFHSVRAAEELNTKQQQQQTYDIVIYGGTICAFTGSLAAARMNKSVAIVLEYGTHFGGMTTGGLSAVDLNMPVGGIYKEFAERAGMKTTAFPSIEAKVASQTMNAMLQEFNTSITILANTYGLSSVNTSTSAPPPQRLISLSTVSGLTIEGSYFIDCSYEGDLLQLSGVDFTYGRESANTYNESLGGSEGSPWLQNRYPSSISPWVDEQNTTLLPTISAAPNQYPGEGDDLVQSYNYRLCLSNDPTISFPIAPPEGYTESSVELLRRWWISEDAAGNDTNLTIGDLFLIRDLPGGVGKIDLNNGNMLFGTDMPFLQREYPTGNWSVRQNIAAAHEWWMRAMWTFLTTDTSGAVPPHVRDELAQYGLCNDEFLTTNHWPPQLYIREGVRMVGNTVLSQKDVFGAVTSSSNTSIGLSRWLVDIHAENRIAVPNVTASEWYVADAGHRTTVHDVWQLSEVPYDVILPPATSLSNFLVPVCASYSHIGIATYRLEPQYAVIGHSAAVAAVLAIQNGNIDLHDVDIQQLQRELLNQGQILNATQPPPPPTDPSITLEACESSNELQQWTYNVTDGTIRLSAAASVDPTHIHILPKEIDAAAWKAPKIGLFSPAERFLRGGRHVRNGLSNICASIFGYKTDPLTPVWAATCHTNDTAPDHQNQEFDILNSTQIQNAVQIKSRLSGLCLGINTTNTTSSSSLLQIDCASGNSGNTLWYPLSMAPNEGNWALIGVNSSNSSPSVTTLCATAPS